MTTRRIIGLSLVATAAMWFQVAGRFEASRIDAQRDARLAARTQAASLRVDSERLMSAVTTLADPKFEGRAAGSPGGVAARAWILERYKAIGLQPVSGSYVFPFKFSRKSMTGLDGEGANVLGMCLGKDPKLPYVRGLRALRPSRYSRRRRLSGRRRQRVRCGGDPRSGGVSVRRTRSAARSCLRRLMPRKAG